MESSNGSSSNDAIIETLTSRGWCFGDLEQVKVTILLHSALHVDSSIDSIESELSNMDLCSFGGKSLPDRPLLMKSSYLQGPKVLQISSVKDISQSSIEGSSGSSNRLRLLRFKLTDGHSEITAIEYARIPSIQDDVIPGTKVRLENKAAIHSGIICLTSKVITVLGGVVQSLYEEWQMNKKYSGYSRSSLRVSQESDKEGPPPFEKLQIGPSFHRSAKQDRTKFPAKNSGIMPTERHQKDDPEGKMMSNDRKTASLTERTEEKPSSSHSRPREVSDSVPVQNQAAAQKLRQKMVNPNQEGQSARRSRHRGKGKQEEESVLTLDEWERRKGRSKPLLTTDEVQVLDRDEDLAWQIQQQFDLEDSHGRTGNDKEADDIRRSMFSFERNGGSSTPDRMQFGGRGRGKWRWRERERERGGRRGR